ncbi:MAG: SMC-Scp complex subunit ScpB [Candidatus Pacebacteria bacterium]|nr:SMC-Scp complex subunit ScpB [Candidatus Paceibacterota bacterium]
MIDVENVNNIGAAEALIYSEGGDMSKARLLKALNINTEELNNIFSQYNNLDKGLSIIDDGKSVAMKVSGKYAEIVETYRGESESEDLSKASLEVLSIALYNGRVTASGVEYIRGVGSSYTLRQLTMRGLLHKSKRGMSYVYTPSVDIMSFLGVTNLADLPGRDSILKKLRDFEKQKDDRESN